MAPRTPTASTRCWMIHSLLVWTNSSRPNMAAVSPITPRQSIVSPSAVASFSERAFVGSMFRDEMYSSLSAAIPAAALAPDEAISVSVAATE